MNDSDSGPRMSLSVSLVSFRYRPYNARTASPMHSTLMDIASDGCREQNSAVGMGLGHLLYHNDSTRAIDLIQTIKVN